MRTKLINSVTRHCTALAAFTFVQTCLSQVYTYQDPDQVYLSTLSYLDASGNPIPFGRDINGVIPRIAQRFHTGPNSNGYLLDTVTLAFGDAMGWPTAFQFSLFSTTAAGLPNQSIGVLAGNPDPGQQGNYTYSASGLVLQPNSDYFLVVQADGTIWGNDQYMWHRATNATGDSNDGWSAGGLWYSLNGGPWTFSDFFLAGAFQINAVSVPEPSATALLLLCIPIAMGCRLCRDRKNLGREVGAKRLVG